jgi:hypothetical protein
MCAIATLSPIGRRDHIGGTISSAKYHRTAKYAAIDGQPLRLPFAFGKEIAKSDWA